MFEVTVLFEGYSRTEEGGSVMHANCTCTLVRGEGITAIVDTRTAWDGEEITEALKKGPCIHDFRKNVGPLPRPHLVLKYSIKFTQPLSLHLFG